MAAAKGRDLLLKVGTGTPVTVAGLTNTSFSAKGGTTDITTKDSAGVRQLLAGANVSSLSISASALLTANAQATTFFTAVMAQTHDAYTLLFDNGDKIEGNFQCTSFEASGEVEGVQTYSITLESAGTVTLTAAA